MYYENDVFISTFFRTRPHPVHLHHSGPCPSHSSFPTANDLTGLVFVQPFAGLAVISENGGIGKTEPFFFDLPDGSLPRNAVVNILGNFQDFRSRGNPTPFDIVGVEVTTGG